MSYRSFGSLGLTCFILLVSSCFCCSLCWLFALDAVGVWVGGAWFGFVYAADIRAIFASVDVDNGNELNFNEFLAATLERRQLDDMRLKLAFDRLDFDHSGTIDGAPPPFYGDVHPLYWLCGSMLV